MTKRNSTGFLVCQDLFLHLPDTLFFSVCINFKDNKKDQGKSRGFEMNSGRRSQFLSPSCLTGIYKKKLLEPYMCVYYKQNKTKQEKDKKAQEKV